MHPIILGITGDHNCGKTTVAQLLETHCNARAIQFSDGIYTEVAQAFGCTIIDLAQRSTKNQPLPWLALQRCQDPGFVQRMQTYCMTEMHGRRTRTMLSLAEPRSPRTILEWWGSEYRRNQDPDYWVNATADRLLPFLQTTRIRPIVLADVYKHNEAALIRRLGGTLWRIECPERAQRTAHATSTEHLQIKADLTLHNIADIQHLQHIALTHWHELERYGHHPSTAPA